MSRKLSLATFILVGSFALWNVHATPIARDPQIGWEGASGLTQVTSAASLGAGRLTIGARGAYFQQDRVESGVPAKGSDITTFAGAMGWGLSPWIDGYAALYGFSLDEPGIGSDAGIGSLVGGLKGSVPVPGASPVRLGVDVSVIGGVGSRVLNANGFDGYTWGETKENSDIRLRLLQSLLFEGNDMVLRIHLNEGTAFSVQGDYGALLLQGAAVEFSPHPAVTLATEFNSRTRLRQPLDTDPLWITPSITFAGPHVQFQLGSDFSLASSRPANENTRALEPWRVFTGISVTVDFMANARELARQKAHQDSVDQIVMRERATQAEAMADSLARKNREDSLRMVQQLARQQEEMKRRADSLAGVAMEMSRRDSLRLVEAQKKLAEEKAARSESEKQFLRTGVLNLEALYFESNKAEISINSKPYLNVIGRMLAKYTKLQLEVGGHTDNRGSSTANLALSQARADAVRLYLISQAPELNGRITARGYGQNVPKVSNRNAEGRQINRRVEITAMNKEVLKEYE